MFARFCRLPSFAVALLVAACLASSAAGQARWRTPPIGYDGGRYTSTPNYAVPSCNESWAGMLAGYANLSSSYSSAGNGYADSLYSPATWLSPADREREARREQMQERRNAEVTRREASRKSIPAKTYTEEDYAKSKFNVAHMLWQNGNLDASRKRLELLIDEYPYTDTADRARITLAKF